MHNLAYYLTLGCLLAAFDLSSAQAPVFPIAARSPYLLSFLPTKSRYSRQWQTGFSGQPQAWAGLIRVDGVPYAWMGSIDPMPKFPAIMDPIVSNQTFYPTRSVLLLQAGHMQLTVTFLSPIEPGDLVKQSIPASYVALEARATDGNAHDIQVYTDISAEWVTGDRTQNVTWSTNTTSPGTLVHSVAAAKQTPYNEFKAQSTWGNIYYATERNVNVTFKTASDLNSRGYFTTNGVLDNAQNSTFRSINDEYPVFAFAHDLGSIQQTSSPLVWAVANVRDSDSAGVADYTDLSQRTQRRSLYYRSQYTDDYALLSDFLSDYSNALNRSKALDDRLMQAATSFGGTAYADLLALATRQAYCGIEVTIGRNDDGSVNPSDLMVFYKDTGLPDDGIKNLVSPVDGLLSIFPMFLYLDHSLSGALLEPLLRFQDDDAYTSQYAAYDMGAIYPHAVASNNPHSRPVEASAAMLIMTYGHAKITGNNTVVEHYYPLLERWGHFLSDNITSGVANMQSDIALEAIIAIQAMSNIGALLGNSTSRDMFSSRATALYSQWKTQALASDGHVLFSYGDSDPSSFSLGYNMFWDLVLGTGLLDTSVIDAQVSYIGNAMQRFGVATNSTNTSVIAANWNMFAAAIATRDTSVQKHLIGATREQAWNSGPSGQFPLIYSATAGVEIVGYSSPRQGAVYAPLLVNSSSFSAGTNTSSSDQHHGTPVGAVVGATVGGLVGLALLTGLLLLFRRRRSSLKKDVPGQTPMLQTPTTLVSPSPNAITPFLQMDAARARSSDDGSTTPGHRWSTAVENKRALGMRRAQQNDQDRVAVTSGPASASHSSASRTSRSVRSDPSHTEALLREITNLRREITAIRVPADNASAPPEYDDV
ncbi:hypothetical protein PENSPDRAFT_685287 [Peniophora sp. CONT]|nr:hypothetical protein PENSPDRAFT_685287 [Peniophora sp. CONT]